MRTEAKNLRERGTPPRRQRRGLANDYSLSANNSSDRAVTP
jgi:hypothetical protein